MNREKTHRKQWKISKLSFATSIRTASTNSLAAKHSLNEDCRHEGSYASCVECNSKRLKDLICINRKTIWIKFKYHRAPLNRISKWNYWGAPKLDIGSSYTGKEEVLNSVCFSPSFTIYKHMAKVLLVYIGVVRLL